MHLVGLAGDVCLAPKWVGGAVFSPTHLLGFFQRLPKGHATTQAHEVIKFNIAENVSLV